jgi:hypothetical protein
MYGDWSRTLWTLLVTFCIVIIRCTETFWLPCILRTGSNHSSPLSLLNNLWIKDADNRGQFCHHNIATDLRLCVCNNVWGFQDMSFPRPCSFTVWSTGILHRVVYKWVPIFRGNISLHLQGKIEHGVLYPLPSTAQSRTLVYSIYNPWEARGGALMHCATNRKVAGSISDGVGEIIHWRNLSGRTMALGSTQPLTKMSTRIISWG